LDINRYEVEAAYRRGFSQAIFYMFRRLGNSEHEYVKSVYDWRVGDRSEFVEPPEISNDDLIELLSWLRIK
jgi:hypothetical protein